MDERRRVWFGCITLATVLAAGTVPAAPRCQVLDDDTRPLYRASLAVIPKSRFDGHGRSAFIELDGDWAFAYFRDLAGGDLELALRMRTTFIDGTADIDLPNQVGALGVGAEWTLRYGEGYAVQAHVYPGVYSDLESLDNENLFFPFSVAMVRSFWPELSGIIGIEVRPGFEREYRPVAGLVWRPDPALRVDARVPDSRLTWSPWPGWGLYSGLEWRDTSYRLREKGVYDRDLMTIKDFRLFGGMYTTHQDVLRFSAEIGMVFDRTVKFERVPPGLAHSLDVESATFVRLAIEGLF